MFSLQATIRQKKGRKNDELRKQSLLPGVLYGEGIKENILLKVGEKEFTDVFGKAGESSIIKLKIHPVKSSEAGAKQFNRVKNQKSKIDEIDVLIHQIARDPLSGRFIHVDFFHPSEKKKIEAEVDLVFEGTAPAVKELGGILVKELQAVEVKGLAQKLPRDIKVDVSSLQSFADRILVRDLLVPEGVEILREPDDIVVHVTPPKKEEKEEAAEKPAEEEKAPEAKEQGQGQGQGQGQRQGEK